MANNVEAICVFGFARIMQDDEEKSIKILFEDECEINKDIMAKIIEV